MTKMKMRIQKILPWALPVLVLVFVLSGCGKDNKIHALESSAQPVKASTQGLNANSASLGKLDASHFAEKCSSLLNGRIEAKGTICASPLALQASDLNPSETGIEQVIHLSIPAGYLIISTGDAPPASADITLNGAHFMNLGTRALSKAGRLAFYANAKSSSAVSVTIWKCVDNKLEHVDCNLDILQGN
jgi:hypothetical protein